MLLTDTPHSVVTERRIRFFASYIILCGIITGVHVAFYDQGSSGSVMNSISAVIHPIELRLGSIGRLGNVNLLNILFYLMMLSGLIVFVRERKDSSGLLRFCFGVLLLLSAIKILNSLVTLSAGYKIVSESEFSVWSLVLPMLYRLILVVASLQCLRHLLKPFRPSPAGKEFITVFPVGNGVRFMHLLIDLFIVALLIYPLTMGLAFWLKDMRPGLFNQWLFIMLFSLARFAYYLLFEKMGSGTPAKFLTGTYVVQSESGDTPTRMQIIGRSCSRFIPFEPLSFLGRVGWHDSLSGTTVVNETGRYFRRSKHWWWVVLLLVATGGAPLGNYLREEMRQTRMNTMAEDYETRRRQAIIDNLSTEHVIVAEPRHDYRAPLQGFIVTSVAGDSVLASMFNLPRNAVYNSGAQLEQYVNESQTTADIMLAKRTLEDAFILNEDMFLAIGDTGYTYHIYDIFSVGIPVIAKGTSVSTRRSSNGKCEKTYGMTLSYRPAQITGIQTIEGQITWTDTFPLVIESPEEGTMSNFQISASRPCEEEDFIAEMHVLATDGKRFTYVLDGTERMLKVSRKY